MRSESAERFRLARRIASVKEPIAQAIADESFHNHPEWGTRFGERGREFCRADSCFHMDFLAGALEAGSADAFADYSRWVARMLGARGIPAHTLEENLEQLARHLTLALLPEEGQAVLGFLMRGLQACMEPAATSGAQASGDNLDLTRQVFLAAILDGQRQAALTIVEETLRAGHSHLEIYVRIFAEALHRVGELWELNRISVAQEHMATSITQYAIAAIYPRMAPARIHRGNMVVTGVAGELHQIGANLVADAMEANGWAVRFLGTNVPHSSVVAAVEECSADVLCISTTIVANLPSVAELVGAVRDKRGPGAPRIVLGGAAYRLAAEFARDLGLAAPVTDLRRALDVLCA